EDLKSFDLLTLPFINPAKTLKSLTLSAGDIFEIQYAMQLTLFKCFCEELLSDAEEDKLWKQETIQVLKRRFDTIKSVDDAKPNYLQGVGLVSAGLVGAVFVAASIVMLAYAIFCLIDFVRKESLEKVLSILIAAISICSQVSGTHYGAFGRLTRGFPLFCDAVKSSFRETRNVRIPLAPPPPEMEEETVPASPQLA
ncbi:MAG: hypothetical protein KDH94_05140, partial [Coxiellaceae bacterium]|nr:hypothetical protein [Coxiellaceae bacterium]